MSLRFFKLPTQRENTVAACFSRGMFSIDDFLDNIVRHGSQAMDKGFLTLKQCNMMYMSVKAVDGY